MATNIVVRGIDIIKLPHVVNFDLPSVAGDYFIASVAPKRKPVRRRWWRG